VGMDESEIVKLEHDLHMLRLVQDVMIANDEPIMEIEKRIADMEQRLASDS
jgi:hypothetical protein